MKTLRRLALASAVSAVACGAHAELQLLDDDSMQDVTGQAGLTIDVESRWEIGEFAYQDAGFLLIQGLRMGGKGLNDINSADYFLDNLRLEVDIAGDGSTPDDNVLAYGFSNMRDIAQLYVDAGNSDGAYAQIASGVDSTRSNLAVDDVKTYDDGDLVIHFDFTDGWQKSAEGSYVGYEAAGKFATESYADAEIMFEHAVDFRFEIDAIGIAKSDYTVGNAGLDIDANHSTGLQEGEVGTTTLISQLSIQGYLGPEDLVIENNGNGFGADGSGLGGVAGTGNADSKIEWSTYFMITDLDVYIDIAGVQITDMQIHNKRGDRSGLDGTSSFDFAHSIREIYAVKDTVLDVGNKAGGGNNTNSDAYIDGIAINTRFKGDIDIGAISFGDTDVSIGSIYMTDVYADTRWTISAH
jgi:hypothetical protein